MTTMSDLRDQYSTASTSSDPAIRAVARRQLERLNRATSRPSPTTDAGAVRPSRWSHVPLADLFEQQGNRLHLRRNGHVETGHEPVHGSKSGRCCLINPATGRWFCRSCGRHGDAATFIMDLNAWSYQQAAVWLAARYGPAVEVPQSRRAFRQRPVLSVEVAP